MADFVSSVEEWAVYRIDTDNLRHWINDPALVTGAVREVSQPELRDIPVGDPVVPLSQILAADGMLLFDARSGSAYAMRAGRRCGLTSMQAMDDYGYETVETVEVGPQYTDAIPLGPSIDALTECTVRSAGYGGEGMCIIRLRGLGESLDRLYQTPADTASEMLAVALTALTTGLTVKVALSSTRPRSQIDRLVLKQAD